jgi:ELWxxDGT repeat protein
LRAGTGTSDSNPNAPVSLNGTIFFAADNGKAGRELWRIEADGGRSMVKDINPGRQGSNIGHLDSVNGKLYFTAYSPATGFGLWTSDGTAGGTTFLQSVSVVGQPEKPGAFKSFDNEIFFAGWTSGSGVELWKSNGTATGTMLLKDIYPGMTYNPDDQTLTPNSSSPTDLIEFNGSLYFAATDAVSGRELWKTDGTTTGTMLVADLYPGTNPYNYDLPYSSYVRGLTKHNHKLYFSAARSTGWKLWRSDGTGAGSIPFTNSIATPFFAGPTVVGDDLYFIGSLDQLWTSKGSKSTTRLVKDIHPGTPSIFTNQLTAVGDLLYFVANDPVNGTELWRSDGTTAGTNPVADLNPGSVSSNPQELTVVDDTLFLTAETIANGRELYRVVNPTGNLVPVRHSSASVRASDPKNLSVIDGEVYFSAVTKAFGRELWKSNTLPPQMILASLSVIQQQNKVATPLLQPGTTRQVLNSSWNGFDQKIDREFERSRLRILISSGFVDGDRLSVNDINGISIEAQRILYQGIPIARMVQKDKSLSFKISKNADFLSIQALTSAVHFHASSLANSAGLRTFMISLLGAESNEAIERFVRLQVIV